MVKRRPAGQSGTFVLKRPAAIASALRKRPAGKTTDPATSLDRIQDALNREGWGIILLQGLPRHARLTRAALLKTDHLLLPVEVVGPACETADQMRQMECSWMGGGTSLGNALWDDFIIPGAKSAKSLAGAGELRPALAELLALLLFMRCGDDWLRDQEVYCNWREFKGFFTAFCAAWKILLARNDAELGLKPTTGRRGGYRSKLLEVLKDWEKGTNETLQEVFDDVQQSPRVRTPLRVRIIA